jgi:hypothetical protein
VRPLLCVVITVLAHFALSKYGFEWTHSDYALLPLTADEFTRGNFSAFAYNMNYGGTTLEVFRAIWVKIWLWFSTGDLVHGVDLSRIHAHNFFSYVICPSLLSLSSYFVTRAYISKNGALFSGVVAAIGLDFLVIQFGNDPYVAYLIFGSALLAWKASVKNPFWDLSYKKLALAGLVCGLAIYTSRISLLYVAVFFLPWNLFLNLVRDLKHLNFSSDKIEKFGTRLGFFFLALWVYLEVFGTELGKLNGRMVKIHAQPNFAYGITALILVAAYSERSWIRSNFSEIGKRTLALSASFLIGFSPEWIHALHAGGFSGGGAGSFVGFSETFQAFGSLPNSFREIFTAVILQSGDLSLTSQGSILFLILTIFAFILEFRRDRTRLIPIALMSFIALYAYCRMKTYTFANSRYLLPVLPAIWVMVGCYWEVARKRGALILALAMIPVGIHFVHQISARIDRIENAKHQHLLSLGVSLIEEFRANGIRVVQADEYWWASNNFTWLAQGNPIFEPPTGPTLRTLDGAEYLRIDSKIGALQMSENFNPLLPNRKFEVLGEVGKVRLYIGTTF